MDGRKKRKEETMGRTNLGKVRAHFTIPPELKEQLREFSKTTGIPMGDIAEAAIAEYLNRMRTSQKRALTKSKKASSIQGVSH